MTATGERQHVSVVFRTDAGAGVGYGHLVRSAALASELRRRGADVQFLLDADPWSSRILSELRLSSARSAAGLDRGPLSTWAARHRSSRRVLIIDRPMLSASYVRSRRAAARADIVACFVDGEGAPGPLDLAMTGSAFWRDADWPPLPPTAVRYSGTRFLCLRPQLKSVRRAGLARSTVRRVVVTLGGGDPRNLTLGVVSAATKAFVRAGVRSCVVDVIVGPGFSARRTLMDTVEAATNARIRFTPHDAPKDPSALLARADLAIAAGGSTLYELAYLGVPTISIPQTDQERRNARAMATAGACVCVEPTLAWERCLRRALADLLRDRGRRRSLSRVGRRLIDGRGASRLAREIERIARLQRTE